MDIFFEDTLTIERNTRIAGTDKYTMATYGSTYDCNLQQSSPEETQMIGGKIGAVKNCFVKYSCPASVADRIIINSIKYKVSAVRESSFAGLSYKKLIVVQEDYAD